MSLKSKKPEETISSKLDYSQGWSYVNLRVPSPLLNQIDSHINKLPEKPARIHWIMQAIAEKLEREKVTSK